MNTKVGTFFKIYFELLELPLGQLTIVISI